MTFRQARGYRITLGVLTLACLCGAGFLAYKTFFTGESAVRLLKAADEAYARGSGAYKQKNWGDAATRFDEARILADKGLEAAKAQIEVGKISAEDAPTLVGRIAWVKARAIRDNAYAKSQTDGKPLPDVPDPQYNETFRTFQAIPDPTAWEDAAKALRLAALRLPSDPEILKEALRFELVLPQIQWDVTEPLLNKSLESNSKDARAPLLPCPLRLRATRRRPYHPDTGQDAVG